MRNAFRRSDATTSHIRHTRGARFPPKIHGQVMGLGHLVDQLKGLPTRDFRSSKEIPVTEESKVRTVQSASARHAAQRCSWTTR